MFTVELYAKIRHAVMIDGPSRGEAAKRFGVHRNTITKMLSFSVPPGYRRRERSTSKKLGPFMAWIDAILEGDSQVHKKQRHTAHRIFERLRDEQGFTGGNTIVRGYVAQAMLRRREMFVPLSHRPGHAQADFGEADGYIGGKKVRFHYFCMDLPHSDGCFVKAYPAVNRLLIFLLYGQRKSVPVLLGRLDVFEWHGEAERMFTVELYAGIRRAVMVDGLSRREAAKRFGVHRNTITKMLQYSVPPGYRRRERPASKKLGPYMVWIDKVLEDDRSVHKKQRHTAQRIFERLRDEEGFSGGYTIVREYVARAVLRSREMFVPLSHRPGHAQADFGQADAYIAGKKVRFHYFCVDLPHSDGCFVKAYPAETAEAFCDGHVTAFDFFGGVPQSILYDNTRLAVARIVKGGERLRSQMFAELQSHYLFEDRFGRPGKGNDTDEIE